MNDPFPPFNDLVDQTVDQIRSRECVESGPLDEVPIYKFRGYTDVIIISTQVSMESGASLSWFP